MYAKLKKVKRYLKLLDEKRYCNRVEIKNVLTLPCGYKKDNVLPGKEGFYEYIPGSRWGSGKDSHAWFYFTVEVPKHMRSLPVYLSVRTDMLGWDASNPQFICYIDGKMRQGIDTNHTSVLLEGKEKYEVYLYAYTGPKIADAILFLELFNKRPDVEALYYDVKVPLDSLSFMKEYSREYAEILAHLDRAVSMLSLYDTDSDEFYTSVLSAREYMQTEFYRKYCKEQECTTVCIGHTHIDCAWKWTLLQTREKVQRSFATVLELMRIYPEYRFMSSQPLLYKYLKEEAPELYGEVKQRVSEGRWECEGAMWVEADCNLSSGESLVRQIIYGKRFFREEFGIESRVLWLPDVFGYSAAMPQILRKCGVDWFVTSKISWNDTNTIPFDTFTWRGIDGSCVNTHFLTGQKKGKGEPDRRTTYVGHVTAEMVAGTYERYKNKALHNEALLTFGFGDGGGGPTSEDLEIYRRSERGIPGSPNARIGFAGEFLSGLEKKTEKSKLLPEWRGELYLEFHRGTYTSIAKNKRNNRKSEFLYLDAELLSSLSRHLTGASFPKEALREGWEMILTNQFHDIIPGSSIKEVYDQSDIDYAKIKEIGEGARGAALSSISSRLARSGGYAVFNPHSFTTDALVRVDGRSAIVKGLPSKGYALISEDELIRNNSVKLGGNTVETNRYRVVFDEFWRISSVYDKKNAREVVKEGCAANEIRIYPDYPDVYDAWEWQEYSKDEYRALTDVKEVGRVDDGARMGIRIVRPFGRSLIEQTVYFTDDGERIDFETRADWHERHLMVKAAFPVDINSDKATYDIQFGTIERPTHSNTSWDRAKFEVCAHKFADLSDGGYGVALMNDCKYGYDVHGETMQLSLFKCATDPNEEADQGIHEFTYSLMPHAGTLGESNVQREAYYLNYPAYAVKASGSESSLPERFSAVSIDCDNVICETLKQAEDSEATVLRLFESKNKKQTVTLDLSLPVKRCFVCDMLERELYELPVESGRVSLPVSGFEIVTLKLI